MPSSVDEGSTRLTPERWRAIEAVFHEAAVLREPARSETIERLCGEDGELAAEVRKVLRSFDKQYEMTAKPRSGKPSLTGVRLGKYRIDRQIGQGGMGAVYLAHREDGVFEKQVAVKVMNPHLADEPFSERFRRERQILADLDHPHIARLLDGGMGENGDPYLVMEYVVGQTLDLYCDERQLSLAGRIRLFLKVCQAVEYAHGKHIVHRDLKPGNILVTEEGVPKLLDFGTAKLLAPLTGDSTTTRFGMMTLRYASPEQLRGEAVSASSDVYSLGIVLYELLTGAWPFGNPQSILAGLDRAVHEVRPVSLTQAITDEAATARAASKAKLASDLKGNLERILWKAMESGPEDRYGSVEELSADLQLCLAGKAPVAAHHRAFWTRRRIRTIQMVSILTMAAVLATLAVRKALVMRSASASLAVLPFVNVRGDGQDQYLADGLTEDVTDELSRVSTLRVIDRASSSRFAGKQPDLRKINDQLHVGLALTGYLNRLPDRVRISVQLKRAPDGGLLWERTFERSAARLASLYTEIASAVSKYARAEKNGASAAAPAVNDEAYDLTLRATHEMQKSTRASYTKAEEYLHKAIEKDPKYSHPYHMLGTITANAGFARGNQKRTDEERAQALALWHKALELTPDYRPPRAMTAMFTLEYDWDWARAERELRRTLSSGPDANAESTYAFLLLYQRRFAEAKLHRRQAEGLDPLSMSSLVNGALFWFQAGDFEHSLEECRKAGKNPAITTLLTGDYVAQGHPEMALRILEKEDERLPWTRFGRAIAYARIGRKEEALRLIRAQEAGYPNLKMPMQWFALVYAALGDEVNTVKWLERSADEHEWQILNLAVHPSFASMRSNPRFIVLERRIGLEP